MVIKTITRSYSKSINTKDYGLTDSWLKVESTMSAEITDEDQDHIKECSNDLHSMVKADVTSSVKEITARMKEDVAKRSNPIVSVDSAGKVESVTVTTAAPLTRPTKHL